MTPTTPLASPNERGRRRRDAPGAGARGDPSAAPGPRGSAGARGRADGQAAADRHRHLHPRAAPHHGEQARVGPAGGVGVRATGAAAPGAADLLREPLPGPAVAPRPAAAHRHAPSRRGAPLAGQLGPVVEPLPHRRDDPRPLLGAGPGRVPRELPALRAAVLAPVGEAGGARDRGVRVDLARPPGALPGAAAEDPRGAQRGRSRHPPAGAARADHHQRRRARAAQADRRAGGGPRPLLRRTRRPTRRRAD